MKKGTSPEEICNRAMEARFYLIVQDFITDSEYYKIKKRIDKFAAKNGVVEGGHPCQKES
jgi:hypothetical protein